jgi:hypothetical protein
VACPFKGIPVKSSLCELERQSQEAAAVRTYPSIAVSCRSVVDLLAPHCRSTIAWEDFETTLDSCRQATLKLLLGNADGPLTIAELHRRVFAAAGCVSALRVCSDRQLSGTAASTSGGR